MNKIFLLLLIMISAVSTSAETRLGLRQAIDMSLDYSQRIQVSEESIKSAESDLGAARAERYPTFSSEMQAFRMEGIPEVSLPFGPSGVNFSLGEPNNYQIDFRFSVPLFTGGKIKNGIRTADQVYRIRQEEYRLKKLENASDCRKSYFNLMIADAALLSAEASKERIAIIKKDIDNLYNNGMADSLDLLETELALEAVNSQVEKQKNIMTNASIILARQLGLEDTVLIVPTEPIPEPVDPESKFSDKINRPEKLISQHRIKAAESYIKLNQADYFPNIGAYLAYTGGKPNRDFFTGRYNDQFIIGGALEWSLNLGRKTGHKIESAKYQKRSAEIEDNELDDLISTQVRIAEENLASAFRQYSISSREYKLAGQKYRLAGIRHREGSLSVNRLLEMEAELTTTEKMNRIAKINYYLNQSEYLRAVGSDRIFGGLE